MKVKIQVVVENEGSTPRELPVEIHGKSLTEAELESFCSDLAMCEQMFVAQAMTLISKAKQPAGEVG